MQSCVGYTYKLPPGYIGKKQTILIIHSLLNTLLSARGKLVDISERDSVLESFHILVYLYTKLRNVTLVTQHTKQDIAKGVSLLLPLR